VTGVFCTSGSEREFTLEGSWHAYEEIQDGQIVSLLRRIEVELANGKTTRKPAREPRSPRRPEVIPIANAVAQSKTDTLLRNWWINT